MTKPSEEIVCERELAIEGSRVDRGTPVTITAIFSAEPVAVYASFMRPEHGRAVIDPGYGNEGSRIRRLDEVNYAYSYLIDTTGFLAGRVDWHIWAVEGASQFGWFEIKDAPPQLL